MILDKTIQEKLLRFSYETRTSSRDFIKSLLEKASNLKCIWDHDHTKKLSERIENEEWYFSIWKKDPTVQSILEMLDEIDLQFHAKAEFTTLQCCTNVGQLGHTSSTDILLFAYG